MTDYVHASPSQRAWYRFKSNKRGYYSLWIFGILFVLSLFAEVISNDEPLIVHFNGEYYFPVFKAYQPGYQNNDAIALMIGGEFKAFKIGYSYDITISRLATNTTGSHEVSLIYNWAGKDAPPLSKQLRQVPCPKF